MFEVDVHCSIDISNNTTVYQPNLKIRYWTILKHFKEYSSSPYVKVEDYWATQIKQFSIRSFNIHYSFY